MTTLSLPAAELLAQTFGCVLCGIYLVTLGIAGKYLLTTDSGRWKRSSEIKWVMVVVSGLLFVNSTLDLVVSTITNVQAFVLYSGPGGAPHIFTHGSGWQTMTKVIQTSYDIAYGLSFTHGHCSPSVFHFNHFSVTEYWFVDARSFTPLRLLIGLPQIYRCWHLWNKSLLVVTLPLLIWLANVACSIRFLAILSQATQGLESPS
jgi:hypothetical protein